MSVYRHKNYVLDMSGPHTIVLEDDKLIFQGSNSTAIPLFVSRCNNKAVSDKFIQYLMARERGN